MSLARTLGRLALLTLLALLAMLAASVHAQAPLESPTPPPILDAESHAATPAVDAGTAPHQAGDAHPPQAVAADAAAAVAVAVDAGAPPDDQAAVADAAAAVAVDAGAPPDGAAHEPAAYASDDAVGWSTPGLGAAAVRSPEGDTQGEYTADDAAGWGGSPETERGARGSSNEAPRARLPHLDAKLRERGGLWLERADPSRIAQLLSSLELAASHTLDFTLAGRPASLRSAAGVRVEYDLAYRIRRSAYDRATLDAYELRFIGLETFIGLHVQKLDLRSGRLVTTLGEGELQSVVDVLNPRDLRQLGLIDPERLRLPLWTTHLSLLHEAHRLEAFVVHEAYFGMLPPLLGRFNPVRKLLVEDEAAGPELAGHDWRMHHVPARLDPRATQLVGRYGYAGRGIDLDLYAGSVLDQLGVARLPAPPAFERTTVRLDIHHPRYTLLAHSGAKTLGDLVLRWELSAQLRRAQSVRDTRYAPPVIDVERHTQLNGLLGLTYFGLRDVNLGADLLQGVVVHNPERAHRSNRELLWPVEAPSLSVRYQHQLLRERLKLGALALVVGAHPFHGALFVASVGCVPRDGMLLKLEYARYQASSHFGFFYGLEENDRLDLSFAWAFTLL